jgi:N-glycosylase/DNA lyase
MAGQRPTSRPLDSATYNKLVGLAYRQQQTDAALHFPLPVDIRISRVPASETHFTAPRS